MSLVVRLIVTGWVGLLLLTACQPPLTGSLPTSARLAETGIAGRVVAADGPAAGSYVYAYRSARSGLRGPADFEAKVNPDGSYWLDLVEGRYYLVARQRQGGADAGPPRTGDAWALPDKNPVMVEPDRVSQVDFVLQGVAGTMLMLEGTLTGGDTGFSGVLVDGEGQTVPGAFVIAYPDADFRRMPEATSPAVGADGRFLLYVPRPGEWCLAARTRTRGQPIAGEPYGVLDDGGTPCRTIAPGELLEVGEVLLKPFRR